MFLAEFLEFFIKTREISFGLRKPSLGGGQFVLIGNLIESQFVSVGDWNFGSAISLILAVLILVAMRLMKKMDVQDN